MLLKKSLFFALAVFFLAAYTTTTKNPETAGDLATNKLHKMQNIQPNTGTIMLMARIKTKLSEEEVLKIAKERSPQFEALPGLLQKYYVRLGAEGEYGGVYIWDSAESLKAFKESELAATIAQAYQAVEPPSIEITDILFQLRE